MRFEIYRPDRAAPAWRWRLVSSNGDVLADSGREFAKKADCQRSIYAVKAASVLTPVVEV